MANILMKDLNYMTLIPISLLKVIPLSAKKLKTLELFYIMIA